MESQPRVLHPMGYGELLDETLELYKNNFALVAAIAAIVYVPLAIVQMVIMGTVTIAAAEDPATMMVAAFAMMGVALIWLPLTIFMTGAMTKAVADRYLGQPSSVGAAYSFVLQRWWPVLSTIILATLLVMLGSMACVIPGIIFAFWVAFVAPVVVVEGIPRSDAITRSRQLVGGHWGRVFVLSFLASIMIWIIGAGVSGGLAFVVPETMQPVVGRAVEGIFNIFLTPIPSIALILLYFDVRVRKEGFDLELLSQSLQPGALPGAPPPPPPEPPPAQPPAPAPPSQQPGAPPPPPAPGPPPGEDERPQQPGPPGDQGGPQGPPPASG